MPTTLPKRPKKSAQAPVPAPVVLPPVPAADRVNVSLHPYAHHRLVKAMVERKERTHGYKGRGGVGGKLAELSLAYAETVLGPDPELKKAA